MKNFWKFKRNLKQIALNVYSIVEITTQKETNVTLKSNNFVMHS